MVAIFPLNCERIRAHSFDISDFRSGRFSHPHRKDIRIGLRAHILVSAAAFRAGAGCPQQPERILAVVFVVPDHSQHARIFIRSDRFWKDGCNHKSSVITSGFIACNDLQIIRHSPTAACGVIGGLQEKPGVPGAFLGAVFDKKHLGLPAEKDRLVLRTRTCP